VSVNGGRLGNGARERGGRRLNSAAQGRVSSATEMPLWYGTPRPACVRGGRGTDRRTVRRAPAVVRCERQAARGLGEKSRRLGARRPGKTRVDSGGVQPSGAWQCGCRGGRRTGAARG
jgi:hypothetical protein